MFHKRSSKVYCPFCTTKNLSIFQTATAWSWSCLTPVLTIFCVFSFADLFLKTRVYHMGMEKLRKWATKHNTCVRFLYYEIICFEIWLCLKILTHCILLLAMFCFLCCCKFWNEIYGTKTTKDFVNSLLVVQT